MSFLNKYQRQPKLYIDLPSSGRYYDDTVIEDEQYVHLPVYAMTAMDEIATKTPDALFSGQTVCDIIKSCIPLIKDPWKLIKTDVDYILAAIKIASYGETTELTSSCTHCKEENKIDFQLQKVLDYIDNIVLDYNFDFQTLKFSLLPITYKAVTSYGLKMYNIKKQLLNAASIEDGKQREEISNRLTDEFNTASIDVLLPYIVNIEDTVSNESEFDIDVISNFLRSNDRELLDTVLKNIKNYAEIINFPQQEIQCGNTECGKTYKISYNGDYANFFDR